MRNGNSARSLPSDRNQQSENKNTASDEVKEAGKTGQMLSEKQIDADLEKTATRTYDTVEAKMEELRELGDSMEAQTSTDYWPYPSYTDLLFGV